jgi:hypothetical protein
VGGTNPGRTADLDVSNGHNQTVILGSDTAEIERALLKIVTPDLVGLEMTAGG